jgi:hypothetical protein
MFAVIGLVLGLGGGSGVAVMRAKKSAPAHDSSVAKKEQTLAALAPEHGSRDGVKSADDPGSERASAPADSAVQIAHVPAVAPGRRDSVVPPTPDKPSAPTGTAAHSPVAASTTTAVAKPGGAEPDPATPLVAPGRISKIFGAMSAKDAARVLQQMDDADVQTVLSGLNDRQAAAILAGFPAERAAAISRATLRGKKGAS